MKRTDIFMLVARLIIGGIFIYSGWMKVTDMGQTIGFFETMGLPSMLAYAVSYGELIGGIMLVLGLWAAVVAVGLAIIMVGAIYFSYPAGLQMIISPLALLGGLIAILGSGVGQYALRFRK